VEQAGGQTIETDKSMQRRLMRRFWRTARGFWGRTGDRRAWPFTIGLAVILLLGLYVSYRMNVWNRDVFNALEKKDPSEVGLQALIYFPLLCTRPGLELLFAIKGVEYVLGLFDVDELVDLVSRGEGAGSSVPVLDEALGKVAGHPDVQGAGPVG